MCPSTLRGFLWKCGMSEFGLLTKRCLVQALHVFDAMLDAGVRPDGATWQILLSQSKYLGRHDVADLVCSCEHHAACPTHAVMLRSLLHLLPAVTQEVEV